MKRLAILLALLWCVPAGGQGVLIISGPGGSSLIDHEYILGDETVNATASLILSTSDKNLLGLSPASSITTFPADGTVTTRAVHVPNTLTHALISGRTFDGQYSVGQGTLSSVAPIAHGIENDGLKTRIRGNVIKRFTGRGISAENWTYIRDNDVSECLTGIVVTTADVMVTDNWVWDHRDAGIHILSGSGNLTSANNHYYGVNNGDGAGNAHVETASSIGAACWNAGGNSCRFSADVFADSYYGVKSAGSNCFYSNCYFQHNKGRDAYLNGPGQELQGCNISAIQRTAEYPGTVSVELAGDRCGVLDGALEMTSWAEGLTPSGPSEGVRINANLCEVRTRLIDSDGYNGTIGIRIVGERKSTRIDCRTYDFNQSSDRILVVQDGDQIDLQVVLRGAYTDMTHPGTESAGIKKYIDTPAGWDGSIRMIDTTTGTVVDLVEGDAY